MTGAVARALLLALGIMVSASFASARPGMVTPDTESARFTACSGPVRDDCVIDGDTFWYAGRKIRVADINTPEVSRPQCPREAQLGARASARLQALLNQGAFTLEAADRDRDPYGRLLRIVTRDGASLGAVLVREGLAEEWRGRRSRWC
jgi:micrococcal nuclease